MFFPFLISFLSFSFFFFLDNSIQKPFLGAEKGARCMARGLQAEQREGGICGEGVRLLQPQGQEDRPAGRGPRETQTRE